ncbi:hypothetical protein FIU94_03720 [Sulfitobacter sp. THAF37]|uniref:GNAT family N-acetyltransferase n=1 Tax=Sulfitobacter sp. THAF37 TaxID=2587855 RepID=UPI0012680BF4|nr:GNAT family N-acetyltransferase [Sulfitobacter sp. THAF37]QFT57923.1 hypothetical protein FIU94_03720 [Sulfitobacter sp. THAF37]
MLEDGLHDIPPGKVATVVTHLEMRSPPDPRAVDLPAGVTFERFTPDVARYRALFDRVGRDWLWFERRVMPEAKLQAILENPRVTFHTLRKDGEDAALLELDFREDDACELAYFGLAPSLIGSGAGRYLMNRATELAWSAPISRFHVHTCTLDSPQALGFYIRSGFVPWKQQIEIAPDPRLTGYLPVDAARHVPIFGSR